ncbi:hypothetical protein Pint_26877 [Pistacia integerrima]|uniref:Uncharacterized protein n=1 Tax=Pistacia integerrima TaxID=434235 RepID=A0ACC0YS74_9ROSI|nr:hypothetical protein Pint_26877 [Pistacia integerrima]
MSKNKGYRKNHLKRETRAYVSNLEVKMEEKEDGHENDGDGDYIKEEEGEEEENTKEEEEATNRKRRGKKTSGNNIKVDLGGSKRRVVVNARLHKGVDAVGHVTPQNPYFMSKGYKKQYLAAVCRQNHVKKDDFCICEFPQTEGNVQDIIKVHIIRSCGSRS